MAFSQVAGAGVTLGESLWGEPFAIAGVTYLGTIADLRGSSRIVPIGLEETADLLIEARRSQFSVAPSASPRALVIARGQNWTIAEVTSDELTYSIACKLRR